MQFRRKTEQQKAEEKALNELLANVIKEKSRSQALQTFREQGAAGVEQIAAILDRMARKDLRFSVAFRRNLIISAIVAPVIYGPLLYYNARTHSPMPRALWLFNLSIAFGPSMIMCLMNWTTNRNSLATFLVELDNIQAVGPLIEALNYGERETRQVVRVGLLKLLPRMKASDAGLLNADQRRSLYRTLGKNGEEWNVTVLRALEQIGDAGAAPFVLPLTKSKNPAIRQAARDCLPFLQDREAQERLSKNLLRASSAADNPAVLLRPASFIPEQNQTQLLRPAGSNTNDGG